MKKILLNKNIVVTRAEHQADEAVCKLENLGANVITFPTIKVIPVPDYSGFDNVMKSFEKIDYLIFTSANAVTYFHKRIDEIKTIIDFDGVTVIAVGNKTAETCKSFNIPIHIIPEKQTSTGILQKIKDEELIDKKILIPCSALAKDDLAAGLKTLGAVVFKIPVYDVIIPPKDELQKNIDLINRNKSDLFIFTSPATYNNFLKILNISEPKKYFEGFEIAAIGEVTALAIEETGTKVTIVPQSYNMDSLIKEVVNFYSKSKDVK